MLTMRQWVLGARPKTLLVGVSGVLIGIFSAVYAAKSSGTSLSLVPFSSVAALCVIVAVFLQIAVNFANDYSDGLRGTDSLRSAHGDGGGNGGGARDSMTSVPQKHAGAGAGSGTDARVVEAAGEPVAAIETKHGPARLAASGVAPHAILAAAGISAAVACGAGLAAIIITGRYWLLLLGVLCLVAAWFYTGGKHPYGYAGWGELSVFLFFGLAVVLGTEYVLLGGIEKVGVFGAIAQGCFAVCVMMVNNLRDVNSDGVHGKRTLEVELGRKKALRVFLVISLMGVVTTAAMGILLILNEQVGSIFSFAPVLIFLVAFASMQSWKHTQLGQFRRALPLASLVCLLNAMVFVLVALFS